MKRKPVVNILWVPGTNRHLETAAAFRHAGANPRIITIFQVLMGLKVLYECDLFCLPGGFGWGDHLRSGWVCANDLVRRLLDQLVILLARGIPIIGFCNGFQAMVCTGILNGVIGEPTILLDHNIIGVFQNWRTTTVTIHDSGDCIWLKGLDGFEIRTPTAHGEGRLVNLIKEQPWDIAATYGPGMEGSAEFPISPNGGAIAGICYGNCMGMMPHPESNFLESQGGGEAIVIFENGVNAVR